MKVIVFGGTSGMGRAVARRLVERGDTVFLLGNDEADLQRSAAENLRIRNALDKCSTNVMIADASNTIIYMNETVTAMLRRNASELRASLPAFDADRLIGQNIDVFHRNPAHQRSMLDTLQGTHRAQIRVGALVVTAPDMDDFEARAIAHGRMVTYLQYPGYGEALCDANGWDHQVLSDIRNHPQFASLRQVALRSGDTGSGGPCPGLVLHRQSFVSNAVLAG